MKNIKIKEYSIPLDGNGKMSTTLNLIDIAIKQPIPGGFDATSIRKIIRIEDAISNMKDKSVLILEDADYDFLKSKVDSSKWGTPHRDILDFIDSITEAKSKK